MSFKFLSLTGLTRYDGKIKDLINAKYTKPSSGIPATDIADGVIPLGFEELHSTGTITDTINTYDISSGRYVVKVGFDLCYATNKTVTLGAGDIVIVERVASGSGTATSHYVGFLIIKKDESSNPIRVYPYKILVGNSSHAFFNFSGSIYNVETDQNKVTSISSSSTDTEYPSAKLLYDQLALKANTADVPQITYSDTDLTPGTSALATGTFYFVYE